MLTEQPAQHEHVLRQISIARSSIGPEPVKKRVLFYDVTIGFQQQEQNLKELFRHRPDFRSGKQITVRDVEYVRPESIGYGHIVFG